MMEYEQTMAQMISKTNCNILHCITLFCNKSRYEYLCYNIPVFIFVPTLFCHSVEDRENEQNQQEKSNSEIAQERDQVFDENACQE
jgi:hypothetical protein